MTTHRQQLGVVIVMTMLLIVLDPFSHYDTVYHKRDSPKELLLAC